MLFGMTCFPTTFLSTAGCAISRRRTWQADPKMHNAPSRHAASAVLPASPTRLSILRRLTVFEGYTVKSCRPLKSNRKQLQASPILVACHRIAGPGQMAPPRFDSLHPSKHAPHGLCRKLVGNHPNEPALSVTQQHPTKPKNKHGHETN